MVRRKNIQAVFCEDNYFPKETFKVFSNLFHSVYLVFSIRLFFYIASLFAVRYLWEVCNEDKCCVVTHHAADTRAALLVHLACLRLHVLRANCNFESKQAISITLFGRSQTNN